MELVLVSACLLGEAVRYDGGNKLSADDVLLRWLREGRVVPVCPEVAGGLPVPRPPAEIAHGAGGAAVLRGEARVLADTGLDVTEHFRRGAEQALSTATSRRARVAVLKEGSPSCGSGYSYDGTFTGTRVPQPGVTTARLRGAGIRVFNETQFAEADRALRELEGNAETE